MMWLPLTSRPLCHNFISFIWFFTKHRTHSTQLYNKTGLDVNLLVWRVQAAQREEAYEETISDLTDRLKDVRIYAVSSRLSSAVELAHKQDVSETIREAPLTELRTALGKKQATYWQTSEQSNRRTEKQTNKTFPSQTHAFASGA